MTIWSRKDSAPKDCTPILGFDGSNMATVYWDSIAEDWRLVVACSGEDSDWEFDLWAELPAPPPKRDRSS